MVKKYDVIIAGGGVSGIAAAISASRKGASVALIERDTQLGGIATCARVYTICGLYLRTADKIAHYASKGFPKEFAEKLSAITTKKPVHVIDGLFALPYDLQSFMQLVENLINSVPVDLYRNTNILSVAIEDKAISTIKAETSGNSITFEAVSFVDCTGNALFSTLSGADIIESDERQKCAVTFSIDKVAAGGAESMNMLINREIRRAVKNGALDKNCQYLSVVPGSYSDSALLIKAGLPDEETSQPDRMEVLGGKAHKIAKSVSDYLISNVELFKDAHLSSVSRVGERTGTTPKGLYTLSEEDVLKCIKFDDGVANGSWPIEYWRDLRAPIVKHLEQDDYYQVRAGCLISKDITNLFFAGRAISASKMAIASARVIGTCLATGYASGIMAAYRAQGENMNDAIDFIREHQL